MKKEKKKHNGQSWAVMAFFVLLGGICGVFMGRAMGDEGWTFPLLLAFIVGVCVSLFLHVIVHEAGHLVFGLLSGYKFSSFRVGSFLWIEEDGKLVLRKLRIAGTGGQCLMAPPELRDGKIPVVLFNLGGCALDAVFSGACFILYLLAPEGPVSVFLLALVLIGVVMVLTNGIPLRQGLVDNDGCNALSLRKDPAAMRAFWVQLKVNDQVARGARLKDLPDEWFEAPSDGAMGNSMVAAQGVFVTNRLMDQHRFEEAEQLIGHYLQIDSRIVGLHRGLMICDQIFCQLLREERTEVVDGLRTKEQDKFMKTMKSYPAVLRTEYVWALLRQKDAAAAEAVARAFEKVAKTYPYPSDIQAERELMQIARDRAGA